MSRRGFYHKDKKILSKGITINHAASLNDYGKNESCRLINVVLKVNVMNMAKPWIPPLYLYCIDYLDCDVIQSQ